MKNLMIILGAMLFYGLAVVPVNGQSTPSTKINYAVLTNKVAQFQPISLASKSLAQEDGDNFGQFKVVLYGPEVVQLTDYQRMKPVLKMARSSSMKLAVCAMALKKMKVDPADIPPEFEVVDNAFLHALELQKAGFFILSL
ncbi:DsrE family protein [Membranicola marinus]|uniref:DsrE family protein n=1 Tax=Membranihabitans marinus TaxID=1227546 RepID=A0A953HU28_9BACT|nr:DsrE family protein [Membranihabitans marinus]MBY5958445.1 DsrE family protein [Membranihabitans marinus]